MPQRLNRAYFSILNTPGTGGNLTVGAAVSGPYRTLGASQDGQVFDVAIEDGTAWEVRTGCTYTHSTATLTRGTLEDSSTGAAIALTSSAKVMVTQSAGTIDETENVQAIRANALTVTTNAAVVNTSRYLNTVAHNANLTLSFSGTPSKSPSVFGVLITNTNASAAIVVTIPSSFSLLRNLSITTVVIPANSRLWLQWNYAAPTYIVTGDPGPLDNLLATTDPSTADDQTRGYGVGSRWVNTTGSRVWVCRSASTGAAVWLQQLLNNNPVTGALLLQSGTSQPAQVIAGAASTVIMRGGSPLGAEINLSAGSGSGIDPNGAMSLACGTMTLNTAGEVLMFGGVAGTGVAPADVFLRVNRDSGLSQDGWLKIVDSQFAEVARFGGGGTTGDPPQIGFFGGWSAQPTITGSRGGNAALANLLNALAALGLIVNSTS